MPHIYGIKNKQNGKLYIGKTTNVANRFVRHKTLLKNNKHWNRHLQRSYNKYGPDCFEFVMLETCGEYELAEKEQKWIDANKPNIYNKELFVIDKSDIRNNFFGKKHTEATRKAMSKAKKGKYLGAANPNYGRKWDEEKRSMMRGNKNSNAKLTETAVLEIKRLLSQGATHNQIAEQFSVSRTVVTRINSGSRWSHIKENSNAVGF